MNLLVCFILPLLGEPPSLLLDAFHEFPQKLPRNSQTCLWSRDIALGRNVLFSAKLLGAEHFVRLVTGRCVEVLLKQVCGRLVSCGYQTPWLQCIFIIFFCDCGTPQYEKTLGSSGPYLKCRWWDLYDVVGIQPLFPARAGVTNSTRHTSFHTACQICGIRHIHTLTSCCLLDWSSVRCAKWHGWKS